MEGATAAAGELNRRGPPLMETKLILYVLVHDTDRGRRRSGAIADERATSRFTVDNFIRAESDLCLGNIAKDGG
jgi:hypothetical protein